jgi:hypothetical protein
MYGYVERFDTTYTQFDTNHMLITSLINSYLTEALASDAASEPTIRHSIAICARSGGASACPDGQSAFNLVAARLRSERYLRR